MANRRTARTNSKYIATSCAQGPFKRKYATARYDEKPSRGGTLRQSLEISAYDPAIPESVRRQLGIEERALRLKKQREAEQLTIKPEDIGDEMKQRLRVVRLAQSKPEGVRTADWYASISRRENVSVPTIYRWLKDADRGKVVSDRAPFPLRWKLLTNTSRSQSSPVASRRR